MPTPRTYIFAGGGSGGHLYPGLAVAQALRNANPQAHIHFMATERPIDTTILEKIPFTFSTQPIVPVPRKPQQLWPFYRAWRQSVALCRQLLGEQPDAVVLGLGGFACAPMMHVAAKAGLPVAMLNPDAVPGLANRVSRRWAQRIFVQWAATTEHFGRHRHKCIVTGCPIRDDLLQCDRASAATLLKLAPDRRTLVITGGSQGGRNVNQAVLACLAQPDVLPPDWQILHLTGAADHDTVCQAYEAANVDATVLPFTDRMDAVLALADLVIGRAGASTLAELTVTGTPAILIPYPYHRDQHQLKNARVLADAQAAQIVIDHRDTKRTAPALAKILTELTHAPDTLAAMARAASTLAAPQAAETIARKLMS